MTMSATAGPRFPRRLGRSHGHLLHPLFGPRGGNTGVCTAGPLPAPPLQKGRGSRPPGHVAGPTRNPQTSELGAPRTQSHRQPPSEGQRTGGGVCARRGRRGATVRRASCPQLRTRLPPDTPARGFSDAPHIANAPHVAVRMVRVSTHRQRLPAPLPKSAPRPPMRPPSQVPAPPPPPRGPSSPRPSGPPRPALPDAASALGENAEGKGDPRALGRVTVDSRVPRNSFANPQGAGAQPGSAHLSGSTARGSDGGDMVKCLRGLTSGNNLGLLTTVR